jgi:hypothetical protein
MFDCGRGFDFFPDLSKDIEYAEKLSDEDLLAKIRVMALIESLSGIPSVAMHGMESIALSIVAEQRGLIKRVAED